MCWHNPIPAFAPMNCRNPLASDAAPIHDPISTVSVSCRQMGMTPPGNPSRAPCNPPLLPPCRISLQRCITKATYWPGMHAVGGPNRIKHPPHITPAAGHCAHPEETAMAAQRTKVSTVALLACGQRQCCVKRHARSSRALLRPRRAKTGGRARQAVGFMLRRWVFVQALAARVWKKPTPADEMSIHRGRRASS